MNSLKSVKTLFQFDGSFFVCLLLLYFWEHADRHVNIFEIFKKFCCEWLCMIIAVCPLGKLKLEKRLFLYECHLKPKRAFQFPYYMDVVYTPGMKNRSVLPKFARQRKTLHLWFKKRSRSSFLSSLSLFTPWTELCRFEFHTKVKTLNYYNIQWEYKTSSLKIASFNTLGL